MIKVVVAIMAALALVVPSANAQSRKTIEVTAKLAETSFAGDRYVRYMTLWNHQKSAAPIGQAFEFCFGLDVRRSYVCSVYFSLPGGKLEASGVVQHTYNFWAPVIGASGRYASLHGSLHMYPDFFGKDDYVLKWELR